MARDRHVGRIDLLPADLQRVTHHGKDLAASRSLGDYQADCRAGWRSGDLDRSLPQCHRHGGAVLVTPARLFLERLHGHGLQVARDAGSERAKWLGRFGDMPLHDIQGLLNVIHHGRAPRERDAPG
jgi:hypothetical protein